MAENRFLKKLSWNGKRRNIKDIFYTRAALNGKTKGQNLMPDESVMNNAIDVTHEIENIVKNKGPLPTKEINAVIDDFIGNINIGKGTILNLLDLKDYDDYTYTHSINVSLLSIILAKKLNYSDDIMKIIGTAGLLHDLGKILIPVEILNKPAKLNAAEFEIMKKHPVYGYEILKSTSSYNLPVLEIVLSHHEKISGTGYPLGKKNEEITELAQIVSVADFFDAITSARSYKPAKPFWFALIEINKEISKSFSPKIARMFINHIPEHLTEKNILNQGDFVLLNTREIAEVTDNNNEFTLTPFVRVLLNQRKEIIKYPLNIDLNLDNSRYIESVIEDPIVINSLNEMEKNLSNKN